MLSREEKKKVKALERQLKLESKEKKKQRKKEIEDAKKKERLAKRGLKKKKNGVKRKKVKKSFFKIKKQQKNTTSKKPKGKVDLRINDFFDTIAPGRIQFFSDYYVLGNTYRCVWAIKEYPTSTEELALLKDIGEKEDVNLKIQVREIDPKETATLIQNSYNANMLKKNSITKIKDKTEADIDIEDTKNIVKKLYKEKEHLIHCAVFIEIQAKSKSKLQQKQTEVKMLLTSAKVHYDALFLRQKDAFLSAYLVGENKFGDEFERVLPTKSVANLFPLNYAGKIDAKGFKIGKDKNGTNIIVDFDRRMQDKTNGNIVILGNAGQGKSYLVKLIVSIFRKQGKNIIVLDPEEEYKPIIEGLGGTYLDMMSGKYIINILEPKKWFTLDEQENESDDEAVEVPETFKLYGLNQHISFLKDWFKSYKDFEDEYIDILEIFLMRLYRKFNITSDTDLNSLESKDYPILADLWELIDEEIDHYDPHTCKYYTLDMLKSLALKIRSVCIGNDSIYFNGYTNIPKTKVVGFGCKSLLDADTSLKNAMLFNMLAYMSNELLNQGNTICALDEFYLFLECRKLVIYVRNFCKRVRKKFSNILISSQNLEDFDQDGIRELTKPLLAIPTHMFVFNLGNVDKRYYINSLQMAEEEYNLIAIPERGHCFFRCGNERYNLLVKAPQSIEKIMGNTGGL